MLSGHYIDYFFLIMNPVVGFTENTKLYLNIAMKLSLIVIPIFTGSDLVDVETLDQLISDFKKFLLMNEYKKIPILIKSKSDLSLFGRNIDEAIMPLFAISAKTGNGLEFLTGFLKELPTFKYNLKASLEKEPLIFDIHEHFNTIKKKVVVAGFISKGVITLGQKCFLGPNKLGNYMIVEVEGLHCKKIPTKFGYKGQFITICLKSKLLL